MTKSTSFANLISFIKTNGLVIIFFLISFVGTLAFYFGSNEPQVDTAKGNVVFNPSIYQLRSLQDSTVRLKDVLSDKQFKIISLLNASCSDCINELDSWKVILNGLDSEKFDVVFIAYGTHHAMAEYNINTVSMFKYPTFYDGDDLFIKLNGLSDEMHKTFIIDQYFNIVARGNPVKNKAFLRKYVELLGQ